MSETAKNGPNENNAQNVHVPGSEKQRFPAETEKRRLSDYTYFEKMFMGEHFEAFSMRIQSSDWSREYSKLRYVMANFAGLISKVVADMLMGESPRFKVPGGDQEFMDELVNANNLDVQLYESALQNSYLGDDVFKIRIDTREAGDEKQTLIIEENTPRVYFPTIDPFNVRAKPSEHVFAWVITKGKKKYLRREIHTTGLIKNEVFLMEGDEIKAPATLDVLGIEGIEAEEKTEVTVPLVYHVPNWKVGNRWNGISDYNDLSELFFAINNRLTKVDNILDKHSDPILTLPPGIIGEDGKVSKSNLGVVEIKDAEAGRPEYVVWDASLENAFKEIEKLVEALFMTSEISPDVLGMGNGQSDTGRALKYKLLRTIAKVNRKKLYYHNMLQEMLYNAQVIAKERGLEVNGVKLKGEPAKVEIDWRDGLPIDATEQIDEEVKAIDAGITSKKAARMRIYDIDESSAEELEKEIEKEKPKVDLPGQTRNPFNPNDPANNNPNPADDN